MINKSRYLLAIVVMVILYFVFFNVVTHIFSSLVEWKHRNVFCIILAVAALIFFIMQHVITKDGYGFFVYVPVFVIIILLAVAEKSTVTAIVVVTYVVTSVMTWVQINKVDTSVEDGPHTITIVLVICITSAIGVFSVI